MRRLTQTLVPLNRMKTLMHAQVPTAHKRESMGAWSAKHEPNRVLSIESVVDIYWALRTWAYACGLAGNYETDFDGKKVLMAPFTTFIDYADESLRKALLQAPGTQLQWLERNDTATRSRMMQLTRSPTKMPWGAALELSLKELSNLWNSLPSNVLLTQGDAATSLREVVPGRSNIGDSDITAGRLQVKEEPPWRWRPAFPVAAQGQTPGRGPSVGQAW